MLREDGRTNCISSRNIVVIDWCCIFKRSGESVDHLGLHCVIATEEKAWVMPRRFVELFCAWRRLDGSHQTTAV